MEVELDLWAGRSSDSVDHILSDVDCCDVPDVDEFILGCSTNSGSDLTKNDLTSSVELHLNQLAGAGSHLDQQLDHHHHLSQQQLGGQQHQSMGLGQSHQHLGPQHASLHDQVMGHQIGGQRQHHHQHMEMNNQQQLISHQQQPLAQPEDGCCDLDLNGQRSLMGRQHQHQQPFGQHPQQMHSYQPIQPASSHFLQQPQQSSQQIVSSTAPVGQQPVDRQQVAADRLMEESLVASRVDHCYMSVQGANCQPTPGDGARGDDTEERQFAGTSSGGNGVSSTQNTVNMHQLQLLLNSQPQATGVGVAEPEGGLKAPISGGQEKGTKRQRQQNGAGAKRRSRSKQSAEVQVLQSPANGAQQPAPQVSSSERPPDASSDSKAPASTTLGGPKRAARGQGQRRSRQKAAGPRASGQVSPSLSSSGVSSLSFSGSASNSSSASSASELSVQELARGPSQSPSDSMMEPAKQISSSSSAGAEPNSTSPGAKCPPAKLKVSLKFEPQASNEDCQSQAPDESPSVGKPGSQIKRETCTYNLAMAGTKRPLVGPTAGRGAVAQTPTFSLTKLLNQSQGGEAHIQLTAANTLVGTISQRAGQQQTQSVTRQKLIPLSSCLIINQSSAGAQQSASAGKNPTPDSQPSSGLNMNLNLRLQPQKQASPVSSSSGASSSPCSSSLSSASSSSMASPASSSSGSSSSSSSPTMQLGGCSSSSSSSPSLAGNSAAASRTAPVASSGGGSSSSSSSSSTGGQVAMGSSPSRTPSLALISNQDWKSAQSGQVVVLTDEERRTLVAEGYPIPQRFPLSKAEERSLKKIRRKIKNKISAQESRRKKKEYMEELEKKVSNMELRLMELERENRELRQRLGKMNEAELQAVKLEPVIVAGAEGQACQTSDPPAEGSISSSSGGPIVGQDGCLQQTATTTTTTTTYPSSLSNGQMSSRTLAANETDNDLIDDILMSHERDIEQQKQQEIQSRNHNYNQQQQQQQQGQQEQQNERADFRAADCGSANGSDSEQDLDLDLGLNLDFVNDDAPNSNDDADDESEISTQMMAGDGCPVDNNETLEADLNPLVAASKHIKCEPIA